MSPVYDPLWSFFLVLQQMSDAIAFEVSMALGASNEYPSASGFASEKLRSGL
jgi:hypothetical protein